MSLDIHKKSYFPRGGRKKGRSVPKKARKENQGGQEKELQSNYRKQFFYEGGMIQGGRLSKEVQQSLWNKRMG